MRDITFVVESISNKEAIGILDVRVRNGLEACFEVSSGPWGKGHLPFGVYNVTGCYKKTWGNREAFMKQDFPWIAPIVPQFETDRFDLAIHPDGNVRGTQGCIGVHKHDIMLYDILVELFKQKPVLILEVL